MCLAIPAKVIEVLEDDLVLVDFGREVRREVSIALMPDKIQLGDWILIHTGYAVSKMEPEEAKETLAMWEEIWRLEEKNNKTVSDH
ncbi:MAG: HypC/HybG/HupF family hydrogenase formation chaperone [Candidatus Hodarchaeota archaeon]